MVRWASPCVFYFNSFFDINPQYVMTKYWPDQGKRVFGRLWGDFNNPRRRTVSQDVAAILIFFINEVKHLTTQAERIFCVILLHFYQPNHSGALNAFEFVKCRIAGKYHSIPQASQTHDSRNRSNK